MKPRTTEPDMFRQFASLHTPAAPYAEGGQFAAATPTPDGHLTDTQVARNLSQRKHFRLEQTLVHSANLEQLMPFNGDFRKPFWGVTRRQSRPSTYFYASKLLVPKSPKMCLLQEASQIATLRRSLT
jgi:hypothetical protein